MFTFFSKQGPTSQNKDNSVPTTSGIESNSTEVSLEEQQQPVDFIASDVEEKSDKCVITENLTSVNPVNSESASASRKKSPNSILISLESILQLGAILPRLSTMQR